MSPRDDHRPPYLDARIDLGKIILVGALFLILLVGAMLWPIIP